MQGWCLSQAASLGCAKRPRPPGTELCGGWLHFLSWVFFFFFFKMICSSWLGPARIVLPFPPCLGEKMPMAQMAPWSQLCSRCGDFIIHHLCYDSGLSHQLLWFNLKKFKYSGLSGIGFWAGEGKEESERKLLWSALPSDVCPRNRRCCVRALTCHPKGPPQSLCALLCVRVLKVHLPNSDYLTN